MTPLSRATGTPGATRLLDQWMCLEHRSRAMGHDGCEAGGEPLNSYTGPAYGSSGRRHLTERRLHGAAYDRDHGMVIAYDSDSHEWEITLADWGQ